MSTYIDALGEDALTAQKRASRNVTESVQRSEPSKSKTKKLELIALGAAGGTLWGTVNSLRKKDYLAAAAYAVIGGYITFVNMYELGMRS